MKSGTPDGAENKLLENPYARALMLMEPMRASLIQAAIEALDLPQGSHGLDTGCGIGLHVMALAEAVGPAGQVTGLDLNADLLEIRALFGRRAGAIRAGGLSTRGCAPASFR